MPLGLAADVSGARLGPQFCAPPSWFRGVEGVLSARPVSGGPFGGTPTRRLSGSAAQKAGIRYERKALKYLASQFPTFRQQPWLEFFAKGGKRMCQPDGLLLMGDFVAIFEIKVRFTNTAWWQLRKLYEPVVRAAFSPKRIGVFLVCKSYDPAVPFPEPVRFVPVLPRLIVPAEWDCTQTGVIVWTP